MIACARDRYRAARVKLALQELRALDKRIDSIHREIGWLHGERVRIGLKILAAILANVHPSLVRLVSLWLEERKIDVGSQPCVGKIADQPCLAPARWHAHLRYDPAAGSSQEREWHACDTHVLWAGQWILNQVCAGDVLAQAVRANPEAGGIQ